MKSPPKQTHAPVKSALQKLRLRTAYQLIALLAKLFEKPFWFFEQRRGRLQDRIDYKGSGR
jgi:hypothetical protein